MRLVSNEKKIEKPKSYTVFSDTETHEDLNELG